MLFSMVSCKKEFPDLGGGGDINLKILLVTAGADPRFWKGGGRSGTSNCTFKSVSLNHYKSMYLVFYDFEMQPPLTISPESSMKAYNYQFIIIFQWVGSDPMDPPGSKESAITIIIYWLCS